MHDGSIESGAYLDAWDWGPDLETDLSPEEIIEKMIEGRLKKFYQESVLLEQTYVIDGESKVADVLNSLDSPVEIIDFVRYELGEGIEKDSEDDFASEVDSMVSGN